MTAIGTAEGWARDLDALAARSSDAHSSNVASIDAPLIGALPSTRGERSSSAKAQL